MEGLRRRAPFTRHVSNLLEDPFTLIDVGSSGGIHAGWRNFGSSLRAFGFDPHVEECARLNLCEVSTSVEYLAGFVGLSADHPFRGKLQPARNPEERLSFRRTVALMSRGDESSGELTRLDRWRELPRLADPEKPIVLADFLEARGVGNVDFVKIDVDGSDFEVLVSLDGSLDARQILGVGIEVNYFGTGAETDNTFHNVDRYMRSRGFDLFGLTVRQYSAAALPGRYLLRQPAQTDFGRPFQGDALYLRDLAHPDSRELGADLGTEKIAKLVCLFDLFKLPDCSAELLIEYSSELSATYDTQDLLDRLVPGATCHREFLARFDRSDPMFFPPKPPLMRALRKRIKQAFRTLH